MRQILSGRSEAASGDADPKCLYHADGRDGFCVIVRCKLSAPAVQKLRHLTCPMVARSIGRLQFSLVEQQPRRSELRGTGRPTIRSRSADLGATVFLRRRKSRYANINQERACGCQVSKLKARLIDLRD